MSSGRAAICHPEEKHYGKDMCKRCYLDSTKAHRSAQKKLYREANKEKVRQMKSAHYQLNKDGILARQKAAYDANPEVIKARVLAYRDREPEKIKARKKVAYVKVQNSQFMTAYGMSRADVEVMLESQYFKCGICCKLIDIGTKRVDHCHETGYVRGLLCWNCNTGIGKLGDNVEGLKRALAYLEREPSKFKA